MERQGSGGPSSTWEFDPGVKPSEALDNARTEHRHRTRGAATSTSAARPGTAPVRREVTRVTSSSAPVSELVRPSRPAPPVTKLAALTPGGRGGTQGHGIQSPTELAMEQGGLGPSSVVPFFLGLNRLRFIVRFHSLRISSAPQRLSDWTAIGRAVCSTSGLVAT